MNKIAIITGGSRGIGRATVLAFAKRGVDVIFSYRQNVTEAQQVVSLVHEMGGRAAALQLDVAEQASFDSFAQRVTDVLHDWDAEKFDILVHNAGNANYDRILDIQPDTLDNLYAVHVKSVVFLTQVLTPLQNDGGVIMNTSSGLTRLTFPGSALYGMMKAAIETLTRYMAVEFADRGIRVNTITPGPIATGFSGLDTNPERQAQLASRTALGRVGQAEDVAKMTVAVALDAGEFVTAQRIEVSGGIAL